MHKKNLFLAFIAMSCLMSCDKLDIDDEETFKKYYMYRISVLSDYELALNNEGPHAICCQEWMYFLENCSYLESLTGCCFHFINSEPPHYLNHSLFVEDSLYLQEWLAENGKKWTMRKSDAYVYKKRRGHSVYY